MPQRSRWWTATPHSLTALHFDLQLLEPPTLSTACTKAGDSSLQVNRKAIGEIVQRLCKVSLPIGTLLVYNMLLSIVPLACAVLLSSAMAVQGRSSCHDGPPVRRIMYLTG